MEKDSEAKNKFIKANEEIIFESKILALIKDNKERLNQVDLAITERVIFLQNQDPKIQYLFATKNEILNSIEQLENIVKNLKGTESYGKKLC